MLCLWVFDGKCDHAKCFSSVRSNIRSVADAGRTSCFRFRFRTTAAGSKFVHGCSAVHKESYRVISDLQTDVPVIAACGAQREQLAVQFRAEFADFRYALLFPLRCGLAN